MKNYLLLLAFALIFAGCQNSQKVGTDQKGTASITYENKPFQVSGNIDGLEEGMVYLKKRADEGYDTLDSMALEKGSFTLKGMVKVPQAYSVFVSSKTGEKLGRVSFFADPTDIMINGHVDSLDKANIKAGETEMKYVAFKDKLKEWDDKMMPFYDAYKAANKENNEKEAKKNEAAMDKLIDEQMNFVKLHARSHPAEPTTPYIMLRYLSGEASHEELEDMVNTLDLSLADSRYVGQLKDRVEILKRVAIGQPAVDFTQNDPDEKPISLSSFKGDYVLVDFWASWCGPCREENPNVVAAHESFKHKGFKILGVSFDQTKKKWLKAIEDDKLAWQHVSDLKGWDNAAGKLYGIRAIPHSMLLDKEGKIIAKNLRGKELHEKLAELMGEGKAVVPKKKEKPKTKKKSPDTKTKEGAQKGK